MPRLSGVDIPENKRVVIALTYLYGIGRTNVNSVLKAANVSADKRAKDLTADEISRLQKVLDGYKIEGDLRMEVRENISRLKRIVSYRGARHSHNLPVRGQRTRTNARTRRGKRMTVGALKKEDAQKLEAPKA